MSWGLRWRPPGWRQVRGNRDLSLLLAAGLVSQTGDWILGTGLAFQVYLLTHSTLASAAVMLATQLPQVVLGSFAGVIVDRTERRLVMVAANLVAAAVIVPLGVVHGSHSTWIIIAVVAATSCVSPFFVAAESSLLPALVRRPDQLVTVNALNAQVRNTARLIGAALGGVIVSQGGLAAIAAADIGSFVVAAALVVAIRHRAVPARGAPTRLIDDWRGGVDVIRRSRVLLVIVAFFALTGIGEGAMGTLFAPFVHDELRGGAQVYGTILAAQAVGGILGGAIVTAAGRRANPRALFAWGTVVFGLLDLALFLFPLVDASAWPAVVIIAIVGLPGAALNAGALTLLQSSTTDVTRGRVFGSLTSLQNAAMLVSTLAAGTLATPLGIIPVICTQGAVYVIVGAVALIVLGRETRPAPLRPRAAFDNAR